MYNIKTIKDLNNDPDSREKYSNYKLCYIDNIPETIYDFSPEIKEKYKDYLSLPFEQYQVFLDWHPECRMSEQPNPSYIPGGQTLYAYFTPLPLSEQYGDDWNDAPYECNAGEPYDDIIVETKEHDGIKVATKMEEYEILKVPFYVHSYNYDLPKDYGGVCVDAINAGAVAWIFDYANSKTENMTAINAGCNPFEFIEKLNRIKEKNPRFKI